MKNVAIFLLIFFCSAEVVFSQSKYTWEPAFPNLPAFFFPTEMTTAGDNSNRFFVTEQAGRIYLFDINKNVSQRKLFLDITDRVHFSGSFGDENGLLGLTFHPDYTNNGYFYVKYSRLNNNKPESVVSRFQVSVANPDSAISSSEYILLVQPQPFFNHNGGCIRFGSDGYLYISLGDGGGTADPLNSGQRINTLLGKILRINVDTSSGNLNYGIPASNPFADSTNPEVRKEIYAYGFRNVWKFSFDNWTDSLWAADVGEQRIEEVNVVRKGGNYGWRCYEGTLPFNTTGCGPVSEYIFPVYEYGHTEGRSITGGFVYRGTKYNEIFGKYIYGDYISGRTWALEWDGILAVNEQLTQQSFLISTFGEDENGDLYLMRYSGQFGEIYILEGPVSVTNISNIIPNEFSLHQNYPNPFNPSTRIKFDIPVSVSNVRLSVFNILGQEISVLVNQVINPGSYEYEFDASDLSSGIYYYILQSGEYKVSRKMMLVR